MSIRNHICKIGIGITALALAVIFLTGVPSEQAPEQVLEETVSVSPVHDERETYDSNEALARQVQSLLESDSTRYAIYVAYPQEKCVPYIYQSQPMRSASMIKVFLLADAMEKVREGKLSLDMEIVLHKKDKVGGAGVLSGYPDGQVFSLDTVLCLMIAESDNTATNLVIDLLGMEDINDYIHGNGYYDTSLARKMMDFDAVETGRENYTSVKDLGIFFSRLYRHECVGYEQDEIMLSYLKKQTDKECFPAVLPEAVLAHKTGELSGLYDDGGIIYQDSRDVILVVMTENYSSRVRAIENMKAIAKSAAAQ